MKIAHIVTLVSPDGAFGGPVRVAANLARATQDAGHEVTIMGAYRGYARPPTAIDGVPVCLFPARQILPGLGFSGLVAPGLVRYLRGHVSSFDLVHVHLARDLVTLPAAAIARSRRVPYVTQTHGMVDHSHRRLANVLDALATRAVLRDANALLHLTEQERRDLEYVARSRALHLSLLPNGVPESDLHAEVESGREVLFLARLHPRKRPMSFVAAAIALRNEFPGTRFTLVGADEGEATRVVARIESAQAEDQIAWEGALDPDQTLQRMSRASVYVLPSVNEPFPMTVLEAMSVGLPCIVTNTCGLVAAIRDAQAIRIVDDSVGSLVAELRLLLSAPAVRVVTGQRARREVEDHFSIRGVCASVLGVYARSLRSTP
jgi:glycosyltransferase involved in cell wall biosynthesis